MDTILEHTKATALLRSNHGEGGKAAMNISVDTIQAPVSDEDDEGNQCGDGFHGPFFGLSVWLLRMNGQWKYKKDSL